jgi:hypothetical protein
VGFEVLKERFSVLCGKLASPEHLCSLVNKCVRQHRGASKERELQVTGTIAVFFEVVPYGFELLQGLVVIRAIHG